MPHKKGKKKTSTKGNPWITHLKKYKSEHKGMSLTDAMKGASHTYKKK
jgi:hypothetical protein|tara:strand:+ start:25 stop:168 length:144 start_codon:yes stop_codon:yes gene_type:complete